MRNRVLTLLPLIWTVAVVLTVTVGSVEAYAAPLQSATLDGAATVSTASANSCSRCAKKTVSLPYIDDVNDWGKGKHLVTIAVCGSEKALESAKLKVVDCKTKKSVKVDRLGYSVWVTPLKDGHVYKITVRAKGQKPKSIKFGVCR